MYICTKHFKNYLYIKTLASIHQTPEFYLDRHIFSKILTSRNICYDFCELTNETAIIICYFYFSQDFLSTFEKFGCSVHSFTYLISRYLNYWSYKVIKSQIKLAVNLKKTMYQCICFTYKNRPVAKDLSWKIEFLIKCF